MKLTKFEDSFHKRLRDPDYALAYLQAALEEGGQGEWLTAVKEVAAASEGGLKRVAEEANIGRESMYKSLSLDGNPRWETVRTVLDTLGYELAIQKKQPADSGKSRQAKAYLPARGYVPPSAKPTASSVWRSSSGYNQVEPRAGTSTKHSTISPSGKSSVGKVTPQRLGPKSQDKGSK